MIINRYIDLPPMTVSTGRMSVNDTGSWRNAEPKYVEHTPPCIFKCPVGNDIVGFLRLTAEGEFRSAWDLILQTSPFPGVCGRVCPHPCEVECNRIQMGGAIKIHSIERFLAEANANIKPPQYKLKYPKRKVAIIGSGPAGLSCAWQLTRFGYPIAIFEKYPHAGGMMRLGIPDFRLPKSVLQKEIEAITASGVDIKTNMEIGRDIKLQDLERQFDAIFIATGFHKSFMLGIDGENHPDVIPGVEFLRKIALNEAFDLKKKVVVIGGGNTAVDTARSAWRMGAEVSVSYRRTIKEMPAISEEVEGMLEEGIEVQFLTAPVKIHYSGNSISKVECVRMELGEADASGRRRPIPIEGSNFYLDAEQIFTAIGETSDLTFIEEQIKIEKWGIPTDEFGRTENPKIFAGGDVATGEGTVTHAIGSGRKTALAIKSFLEGGDLTTEDLLPPALKNVDPHIVTFENLNLDYFDQREAVINKVLGVSEALYEAQRCFSCGTCPGCDNCFVFCPDTAISHASEPNGRYLIDIKHCKGCGLCYAECPRFCIEFNLLR